MCDDLMFKLTFLSASALQQTGTVDVRHSASLPVLWFCHLQDALQQAFEASDAAAAGLLSKQQCVQALSTSVSELLHLSPEVSANQKAPFAVFHSPSEFDDCSCTYSCMNACTCPSKLDVQTCQLCRAVVQFR